MATTTGIQQGDVALTQTNDGGDFEVFDGIISMCPGLEVAAYLSLYGGNEQDDGNQDNVRQYWGNFIETLPERKLRSRTQYLLRNLPATASNLRRVEDAALADLAWMLTANVANNIEAEATIPQVNTIQLTIVIEAFGNEETFTFTDNWKASI